MQKLRIKLSKGIYWGSILDYVMQSYITICFSTFITLAGSGLDMSSPGLAISSVSLIVFLVILIVMPIWTFGFLILNFDKLKDEDFE